MYKILNKLFGWDYIYWENLFDSGISRVYKSKDNKVYFSRYKFMTVFDVIKKESDVIWLTCKSNKYFN